MKNILTLLTLLISITFYGQTAVIVLGSVHEPTKFVNADTIFNIIKQVQPDIILLEADTTLYSLIKTNLDENEINAVRKYLEFKPQTILKAVDYVGRQEFYKSNRSFELKDSLNKTLGNLISSNKLDSNSLQILQTYSDFDELCSTLSKQPLRIVNSELAYQLTEKYQTYTYEKLQEIIDKALELKKYSSYYKRESKFWFDRNKAIAVNSLNFIQQYKPKKAIIITGFFHKTFVLKELNDRQKDYNITIKEYWE